MKRVFGVRGADRAHQNHPAHTRSGVRGGGLVCAVVAVSAMLISGCGDDDDDAEATTSAPPPSSSVTAPTDEVLPVPSPRDASRLITDPCSAFTREQLLANDVDAPGELLTKPSERSPETCSWDAADLFTGINLDVFIEQFREEKDATGYLDTGRNERVERIDIGGNPAAVQQIFVGDTRCETDVIVAPLQVLSVGVTRSGDETVDPCARARQFAEIAVGNLPPLG